MCDEKYSKDVVGIYGAFERWMNPSVWSSSDRGKVWGSGVEAVHVRQIADVAVWHRHQTSPGVT